MPRDEDMHRLSASIGREILAKWLLDLALDVDAQVVRDWCDRHQPHPHPRPHRAVRVEIVQENADV